MLLRTIKDLFFRKPLFDKKLNIISLGGGNFIVMGKQGIFLANQYDFFLGQALIKYGECIDLEGQFLQHFLSPGDNLVEVGANIGVHTVSLARHVGPGGSVIAIEPQPPIYRALNANLALNGLLNVVTHAVGCGRERTEMVVPFIDYSESVPHNSGGVSLQTTGPGTAVQVIPLDELIAPDFPIRLLKIDVEGMESDVLAGAVGLIERYRPILYVENDRLSKRQALIEQLLALDYRLWWHLPRLYNPDNFFAVTENIYGNVASINMICLPRESGQLPLVPLEEITDSKQNMSHIGGG